MLTSLLTTSRTPGLGLSSVGGVSWQRRGHGGCLRGPWDSAVDRWIRSTCDRRYM